ncbi:hypothetical protein F5B22DRAFT_579780 [Xylaria bambusicola]|uniref:uncharacterized protein n=1 Tax=Xylaria bambusicola TaxID=326684 RepID=UPI002007CAEE|nr:uncharacterized protein F5B22DRAFT_579780 [Xylaria bambusicola]KAI0502943.1 hypothetical protein F5B22DRAFT_579780 [Xylaria bambusicola]
MKSNIFLRSALLGLQASLSTQLHIPRAADSLIPYPTRKIGNVSVVDTKIVREAQAFARSHSSDVVWNHIVRGWLYGSLIIAHNDTLRTTVDAEAHAMAAILHDLGWDQTPNSTVVSTDRRFEVDGAIGARNFINSHSSNPKDWNANRVQLVWDSIALHTQPSIFEYKQDTVAVTGLGILMDFEGPAEGVTQQEYDAVVAAFPKVEFEETVNQTFVWLCQTKPKTTYDTFMQPWGDNYVANYSADGYRIIDIISALPR